MSGRAQRTRRRRRRRTSQARPAPSRRTRSRTPHLLDLLRVSTCEGTSSRFHTLDARASGFLGERHAASEPFRQRLRWIVSSVAELRSRRQVTRVVGIATRSTRVAVPGMFAVSTLLQRPSLPNSRRDECRCAACMCQTLERHSWSRCPAANIERVSTTARLRLRWS